MSNIRIKSFELRNNDDVISINNLTFESAARTYIGLEWTINDSNWTSRGGTGNGDSILSQGALKTDDNLIFMAGYGDGFGIRRINDDGTFTTVHNDLTPANGYAYYTSLAVDKKRKHAYVGNWAYDNLTRYDYSDTSSITKETLTQAGNDLPSDEVGYVYYGGLEVVGDYLYIMPDDAATTQVLRWLIPSQSNESLTVKNVYSTSQYGHCWYDEEHDRLYYYTRNNGMLRVVTNPSYTASYAEIPAGETTASAFQVRIDLITGGNDIYMFVCVPDNDNPDIMWLSTLYGRYAQMDITACIAGTTSTPTLVKGNTRYNAENRWKPLIHYSEALYAKKHPAFGSDMPIMRQYGTWSGRNWLWLDIENGYFVGPGMLNVYGYRRQGITTYQYKDIGNQLDFSTALVPEPQQKIQASQGTEYWVIGGYGGDGNALISYAVSDFPNLLELHTSGYIIFGTYQFNDYTSITSIKLENFKDGVFEPTDTKLKVFVSNNFGNVWEQYGWKTEADHVFRSRGNGVRIKFILYGTGKRGAYIISLDAINVCIRGEDRLERNTSRNYTVTKLQGL